MFIMVTSAAHPSGVPMAADMPQSSAGIWISLMVARHAASVPQSSLSDLETYFLRKYHACTTLGYSRGSLCLPATLRMSGAMKKFR